MASEQTPTGPCPDCGTEIPIDAPEEGGCPDCGYTHPDAGGGLEVGDAAVDEPEWPSVDDVDWAALWRAVGYDEPGPVRTGAGVSVTQAAGALATDERTPSGWSIAGVREDTLPELLADGTLIEVARDVVAPREVIER